MEAGNQKQKSYLKLLQPWFEAKCCWVSQGKKKFQMIVDLEGNIHSYQQYRKAKKKLDLEV